MPGHESKVCKLKKSLYGLKQAPKQWHQKFNDVVSSNGFSLNQADKCVYSKFDASGKGVIICLYVDGMLIVGTDQDQVNKNKEFLSSKFDMKDLGEAEVNLGIRIKRGNNARILSSYRHNKGTLVSQLEYSRAIGCLMYAMISTRLDIAFAVEKLSGYTSNPSALHWQALGFIVSFIAKKLASCSGFSCGFYSCTVISAVENDKGLPLLRVIKTYDKESSPNKEYDVKESVSNKDTFQKRDLGPIIDLMRGVKSKPGLLHIGDLYEDYAYEIYLDDSLYNIRDVVMDLKSELWMINIPKKN
nr:zinc finger, CCHC-type [Tanacetum cinerariifolium]